MLLNWSVILGMATPMMVWSRATRNTARYRARMTMRALPSGGYSGSFVSVWVSFPSMTSFSGGVSTSVVLLTSVIVSAQQFDQMRR